WKKYVSVLPLLGSALAALPRTPPAIADTHANAAAERPSLIVPSLVDWLVGRSSITAAPKSRRPSHHAPPTPASPGRRSRFCSNSRSCGYRAKAAPLRSNRPRRPPEVMPSGERAPAVEAAKTRDSAKQRADVAARAADLCSAENVEGRVVRPHELPVGQKQLSRWTLELGAEIGLSDRAIGVVHEYYRARAVEVDVLAARLVDDPLLEGAGVPLGPVAEGREVAVVSEDLPFDRERAHAGIAFVAERAVFPSGAARQGRRSRDRRGNRHRNCYKPSPHKDSFPRNLTSTDRTRSPAGAVGPLRGPGHVGDHQLDLGSVTRPSREERGHEIQVRSCPDGVPRCTWSPCQSWA